MNKKVIIPSVLGVLILIFIVSKIIDGGKIVLVWDKVTANTVLPDSIELKVYVENSGSMDAYMCSGSNLKDAVYDYISDLKKYSTACNLYYINSNVIPCQGTVENYIKNLTPVSFAKAGGHRGNTNLPEIIANIINKHSHKTISVFVSDCILDIPTSATNFFGYCQVSIKNTFNEAIAQYPNLGVQIIKLQSKFDGMWFCGTNSQKLSNVKRPYYIWVIGDKNLLAYINKKVPVYDIIGGIQDYCAYSTSQTIPFDISQTTFKLNHSGKINVEVLADLSNSLQENKLIENIYQYNSSDPLQVQVLSVAPIKKADSKYSHVIRMELSNPKSLKSAGVTFVYPQIAQWVKLSNDSTGLYANSVDKTTGILYFVQGVADAYKEHLEFGSIEFNLKNK